MKKTIREIPGEFPDASRPDQFESAVFAAELGACPEIDLHGLSRDQAEHELDRFMHHELMRGSEVIRIIHGRGTQILHTEVRKWLEKQKAKHLVAYFRDAQNPHEQNGVTYAALHRLK